MRNPSKNDATKIIESSNVCPFRWNQNRYLCFICEKTYLDITELRYHTLNEHSREKINLRVNRMHQNVTLKVEITDLLCTICTEPAKDLELLKTHLTKNHDLSFNDDTSDPLVPFKLGDNFTCLVCSKVFIGFHSLNIHMRTHFQKYICDVCAAGYSNTQSLNAHKNRHKMMSETIECRECKVTFTNSYKKTVHMKLVHKIESLYKCPYCPERFKAYYLRTNHLTAIHGVPSIEHKCQYCNKVFPRRGPLNMHVNGVHLKEKRHECDFCGHKCFQKAELKKHMVSHTGERNFHCNCGKSYTLRKNLVHHMKTHQHGEKSK